MLVGGDASRPRLLSQRNVSYR